MQRRGDKLSQYASRKIALKTGEWKGVTTRQMSVTAARYSKHHIHQRVTVRYSLLGHLAYRAFSAPCLFLAMRILRHLDSRVLQLRSEDIVADMAREMDKVLVSLRLPKLELTT